MKREWFEPGPDGKVPFTQLFDDCDGSFGASISAAFRALLAEEAEVTEPPAMRVGDVVRLEAFEGCIDDERIGYVDKVKEYYGTHKGHVCVVVGVEGYIHPISALTLIRAAAPVDEAAELRAENARLLAERDAHLQNYLDMCKRVNAVCIERENLRGAMAAQDGRERAAGEACGVPYETHGCDWPGAVAEEVLALRRVRDDAEGRYKAVYDELTKVQSERDDLKADVERLTGLWNIAVRQRDEFQCALDNERSALTVRTRQRNQAESERDALRARIDAGIKVYNLHGANGDGWSKKAYSEGYSGTVIDIAPISDAGDVADERVGKEDRREIGYTEGFASMKWLDRPDAGRHGIVGCTGDVIHARSNDRRRTPGTRADRKAGSNE